LDTVEDLEDSSIAGDDDEDEISNMENNLITKEDVEDCTPKGQMVGEAVIVEKAKRNDIPDMDQNKFLVRTDCTVGQLVYVIRKRINLSSNKAIFILVKNALPSTGSMISSVYEEHKDEDGFLYVTYTGENTFGKFS
ncbi:hypothetical protein KI387_022748, partial [Taxus chinensis]